MDKKRCYICKCEKSLEEFNRCSSRKDGRDTRCKSCDKEYRNKHRSRINKRRREYMRTKRQNSSDRILDCIRRRINDSLKNNRKSMRPKELLGCTIEELKSHLQATAISNGYKDFDIESYDSSKYHIDHIKPCSSFNLEYLEEQKNCFHHTNLQILTAEANLVKGAS